MLRGPFESALQRLDDHSDNFKLRSGRERTGFEASPDFVSYFFEIGKAPRPDLISGAGMRGHNIGYIAAFGNYSVDAVGVPDMLSDKANRRLGNR